MSLQRNTRGICPRKKKEFQSRKKPYWSSSYSMIFKKKKGMIKRKGRQLTVDGKIEARILTT